MNKVIKVDFKNKRKLKYFKTPKKSLHEVVRMHDLTFLFIFLSCVLIILVKSMF